MLSPNERNTNKGCALSIGKLYITKVESASSDRAKRLGQASEIICISESS